MSDNIWSLLSALPWPVAVVGIAYNFRKQLSEIAESLVEKFKRATKVKIGALELEGQYFDPKGSAKIDGNIRSEIAASKEENDQRENIYKNSRYLMLAHKIAPSLEKGQKFDVSIFLVRKTRSGVNAANFDDVEEVSYYLGSYFGQSKYGSKFVIRDPTNGFAMKTSAYGQALCIAEIKFRDGKKAEQYRFLDFSMGEIFN